MNKCHMRSGDALRGPEQFFVHGCNAQGVMGSGIAKQVKEEFPGAFLEYAKHVELLRKERRVIGGTVCVYHDEAKTIINAITQNYYGRDGTKFVSYDYVDSCFKTINQMLYLSAGEAGRPVHLAMPLIGAGLGGGNWNVIKEIILSHAENYIPVVYTR